MEKETLKLIKKLARIEIKLPANKKENSKKRYSRKKKHEGNLADIDVRDN